MQLSNKTLSLWGKKNVNDDNEKNVVTINCAFN